MTCRFVLVIALSAALSSCSRASAVAMPPEMESSGVSWQTAADPVVVLGIRDQYGKLEKYKALFVVTSPKGETSRVEKDCEGEEFCQATYPEDFQYGGDGVFTWTATVGADSPGFGRFEYSHTGVVKVLPDAPFKRKAK